MTDHTAWVTGIPTLTPGGLGCLNGGFLFPISLRIDFLLSLEIRSPEANIPGSLAHIRIIPSHGVDGHRSRAAFAYCHKPLHPEAKNKRYFNTFQRKTKIHQVA